MPATASSARSKSRFRGRPADWQKGRVAMRTFRHRFGKWQAVICLALILCAALVIARSLKFSSRVDVTLPAVLWEGGEAAAVNTTLHFHGELVKQWGQDDSFSGYLELEDQPFTSEEANRVMLTMAHEGGG